MSDARTTQSTRRGCFIRLPEREPWAAFVERMIADLRHAIMEASHGRQ